MGNCCSSREPDINLNSNIKDGIEEINDYLNNKNSDKKLNKLKSRKSDFSITKDDSELYSNSHYTSNIINFTLKDESTIIETENKQAAAAESIEVKETPLVNAQNMNVSDEKFSELLKIKERIYKKITNKDKDNSQNKQNNSEIKAHKKSRWILAIAMKLEKHIYNTSILEEKYTKLDDYTKLILDKPINKKKSKKLTKVNFQVVI